MSRPTLSSIQSTLSAEFPVELVTGTAATPDQLFIDLGADEDNRAQRLELVFLPHEDHFYCLQFFVLLPFEAQRDKIEELARLVARINLGLPLVGFGLGEDEGWIFFRAIMPCPHQTLDADVVARTVELVSFIIELFGPVLDEVNQGVLKLEEAFETVAGLQTGTSDRMTH